MQKRYRYLLTIILVATHQNVWGIDLQPNDIVAPAPGRTAVTVSYINSQNNNFYVNGLATGGSPNLENNSALFRLGHTYTIGSLPAITYVQTGSSALSPDGSIAAYPTSKGMTDTTIATAICLMLVTLHAPTLGSPPICPCQLVSTAIQNFSMLVATATVPPYRWASKGLCLQI